MRYLPCAALFGCALAGAAVSGAVIDDPDRAKLQGKWAVESFEYNGVQVDLMKGAVRQFKDDAYTLTPKSGDAITGAVKLLDSTKKPKAIDLEVNSRTLKGIYEVEGDTLKLCYSLSNPERPTEFASKPDSGVILVVHQRIK